MNDKVCKIIQMSMYERRLEVEKMCDKLALAVCDGNENLGRRIVRDLHMICHEISKGEVLV